MVVASRSHPASGRPPLALSDEQLRQAYHTLLRARALEERAYALNRQGKAPLVASSKGHEVAQIASAFAVDVSRDVFYPYYRDIPLLLCLGYTPLELLLGLLAKAAAPFSHGRQFSFQGGDPVRRVFSNSNVVASQLPHAVGSALALKLRKESAVVMTYFGDGATSEGEWHESLNFAAVHRLPVIFFCENNDYAISVPLRKQLAVERISARAAGYGMPGVTIDGTELLEVFGATQEAVSRARSGGGPSLLEARVPRLVSHTTDDDESRYRSAEELAAVKLRDPLPKLRSQLVARGLLTGEDERSMAAEVQAELERATQEADAAPLPDPATLHRHLFSEPKGA